MGTCVTKRSRETTNAPFSRISPMQNIKISYLPYTHPWIKNEIYRDKDINAPILDLMSNTLYLNRLNHRLTEVSTASILKES